MTEPIHESQSIDEAVENLIKKAKAALPCIEAVTNGERRIKAELEDAIEDMEEWIANTVEENQTPAQRGWTSSTGQP